MKIDYPSVIATELGEIRVVDSEFPILRANGDGRRRLFALVGDVNRR